MNILFLHGWNSVPGGVKPTFLADHGHIVINPALDDDDFDAAVRTAQAEFDQHQPDVIVGSSRGGAVTMNIVSGIMSLVLLCPAWKNCGMATAVKPNTTILHSRADDVVPFADSEELVRNSSLPESALLVTGYEHRLADPASLELMLDACWDDRYHAIHESSHALVGMRLGLTPRRLSIGRTRTGTSGGIEYCSTAALHRDSWRYLVIAVAGKVGTRLFGYKNRLVSENLAQMPEDEEPGWMSDESKVWEDGYVSFEIQEAESEAQRILERKRAGLMDLSDALIRNGELGKDEIRAIIRRPN